LIKIDNLLITNFVNAIRGMRNPLESWHKSDSYHCDNNCEQCRLYEQFCWALGDKPYILGNNDYKLAMTLVKAGTDHAKFLRQIFVSMDITAPLYWWKEMDTYKVGTTTNSTSTMHKLGTRLLQEEDFSWDNEEGEFEDSTFRQDYLLELNRMIYRYQEYKAKGENEKAKNLWRKIVQDLPSSYNQMRTWTGNYAVLRNIYHARKNHKLKEWRDFCKFLEEFPYAEFIIEKREVV